MTAEESLSLATSEWQRKYGIADGDPMIGIIALIRILLEHARMTDIDPNTQPPTVQTLRGTIELLDRRSESLASVASNLSVKLSEFTRAIERIRHLQFLILLVFTILGIVVGFFIGRLV
jgi:hypothetical protein